MWVERVTTVRIAFAPFCGTKRRQRCEERTTRTRVSWFCFSKTTWIPETCDSRVPGSQHPSLCLLATKKKEKKQKKTVDDPCPSTCLQTDWPLVALQPLQPQRSVQSFVLCAVCSVPLKPLALCKLQCGILQSCCGACQLVRLASRMGTEKQCCLLLWLTRFFLPVPTKLNMRCRSFH